MDILSLLQQLQDKDSNNSQIQEIEKNIIQLIKSEEKIDKNEYKTNIGENDLTVEKIYEITDGKIEYKKAKAVLEFIDKLTRSRINAIEYADIIKSIINIDDDLVEKIKTECFTVDKDIVVRKNNRGFKISESVNIGLDENIITNNEILKIVQSIQNLSYEELQEIYNNGLNNRFLSLLENHEKISENQYFAEAIIDGINLKKIYKSNLNGDRNFTDDEKKILLSKLENVNCKKLFNAFKEAGINEEEISGYIINLLINEGYKGYSLEELSKLENLEEIIKINIKNNNLRGNVSAIKLDAILGIIDDLYQVSDTNIKLRDYQYETLKNIDEIFQNKRYAAMILPTGAGKSFIAMSEMIGFKNLLSNNKSKNSNIVYVAPQHAILHQFQIHLLKNVLHKKIITNKEIEKLKKEGKEIPKDVIQPKDFNKVLREEFPSLKMFCYDTLAQKAEENDEEWFKSLDADLIILDEAHRTGAKTYLKGVKKLIELNTKAKILAMTATPVRDVDGIDMSKRLAELCGDYTMEEIAMKRYLACEMKLLDAMQEGLVVCPKIVAFDYSLGDSQEYKELTRMIENEKSPEKLRELINIRNQMNAIIKKSEIEGIHKIFSENIKKKNGKYIIFLPPNRDKNLTSEEYMKQEIEKVKGYLKDVNENIKVSYLLSDREKAKENNAKALEEFENADSDELKLLFAIDMLNEGVHVDGIDGAIMLRSIGENSKILYLQQIGRCIFSEDPNNPTKDEDRPLIFDVYNNYLAQNLDREANKTNSTSDFQKLCLVVDWMNKHGYIPDINSENISEARKAIVLKNIQKKYKKYLLEISNKNLTESEIWEIEQIIELGKQIDLWDIEIPDRIIPPGERDISRNNTFKVTGVQKEFIDLFKKARKLTKDKKPSDNFRITREIMPVLDILSEYGVEINNQNIPINSKLADILSKIQDESVRQAIIDEIDELGIETDYKIGEEYNFIKEKFYKRDEVFEDYEFGDIKKCGIFESFIDSESFREEKVYVNRKFISGNCPRKFVGICIITGTRYDENGYDENGYDENGYDKNGYDKKGYNKNGYDKSGYDKDGYNEEGYDKRNFDKNGIHKKTHGKYDEEGYDVRGYNNEGYDKSGFDENGVDKEGYDRHGFNNQGYDRNGYDRNGYDKRLFNKKYKHKITGTKYDENGFDYWGYDKEGFNKEGFNRKGYNKEGYDKKGYDKKGYDKKGYDKNGYDIEGYNKEGYNKEGFDREGYDKRKFDKNKKNKVTHSDYDEEGFDFEGFDKEGYDKQGFNKKNFNRQGVHKTTNTMRDEEGYDENGYNVDGVDRYSFGRNGHYYKKDEEDKLIDTGLKYNPYGFKADGIHVITNRILDLRAFDIAGRCRANNNSMYDINGFKQDGTYMETGEKYHNGFNAYGVDKDGKNEKGELDKDIQFAILYVEAVIKGKRKDFIEEYYSKKIQIDKAKILSDIDIKVYRASLMYPKLRNQIMIKIMNLQKAIKQREELIKKLDKTSRSNKAEIEKIKKENEILNQRIRYLDPTSKDLEK